MLLLVIGLSVGACVYFLVNWLMSRRAYQQATLIQRANATIDETRRLEARQRPMARLRHAALVRG